jgi:ubiquitin-protein ligase
MDKIRNQSIIGNYKKINKARQEYFDVIYENEDIIEPWIIKIRDCAGNNDEFKKGEYLVRVIPHKSHPRFPPDFYFLTPNGVYQTNTKICISIGSYHPGAYPPTIGLGGFIRELCNGMMNYGGLIGGIGILPTADDARDEKKIKEKQTLASNSKKFNEKKFPEFTKRFKKLPYTKLWKRTKKWKIPWGVKVVVFRYLRLIEIPGDGKDE